MTTYTITTIETPGYAVSDDSDTALCLNQHGHVAGSAQTLEGRVVFLYDGTRTRNLGTLGGMASTAQALNDADQVGGYTVVAGVDREGYVAFVYDGTTLARVDPLAERNSQVVALNNHEQIVIQCDVHRAFVTTSGTIHPLVLNASYRIQARSINTAGHVVGLARKDGPTSYAFVHDGERFHLLEPLPSMDAYPRRGCSAWDINNRGQIVGLCAGYGDNRPALVHAFLADAQGMHDLGTLDNCHSKALAINEQGDVVGYSWHLERDTRQARALLWQNRRLLDLNDLVCGTDWQLRIAADINDAGQIVGWGELHGQLRVFLLTPIPSD